MNDFHTPYRLQRPEHIYKVLARLQIPVEVKPSAHLTAARLEVISRDAIIVVLGDGSEENLDGYGPAHWILLYGGAGG